MKPSKKSEHGFTLLEILISMAIFCTISIIAINVINRMRSKANTTASTPKEKSTPTPSVDTTPPDLTVFWIVVGVIVSIAVFAAFVFFCASMLKRNKQNNEYLRAQWEVVYDRFDKVRLEWGGLCSDPLAVLQHSRLLDVSFQPTQEFMTLFSKVQDKVGILSANDTPSTEQLKDLEDLTIAMEIAWDNAFTLAERSSYRWLPEHEQKLASQATKLLKLAADETATLEERALAAEKASNLLLQIMTVTLPETSFMALEATHRLALEAPV